MRSKTVIRYFCDHCSKGGFKKPNMENHETSCTMNPKRFCYLCEGSVSLSEIITKMKERLDVEPLEYPSDKQTYETKSKDAIKWLMEQCAWCPACALSVLRQGKIMAFDVFNYKESLAEYHKEKNEDLKIACGIYN